jgi:hypothetical protein
MLGTLDVEMDSILLYWKVVLRVVWMVVETD